MSKKNKKYSRAPVSFWSLNDKLSEKELAMQIDSMKKAGWGGFYLHARPGRTDEYMGEDWMRCMKFCVDHAEKQGMQAWLYDEDAWPSGTCGNRIAKMKPEYRETHLFYAYDRIPHAPEDVLEQHRYAVKKISGTIQNNYRDDTTGVSFGSPRALSEGEEPGADERAVYIYVWRAPLCNSRFGMGSYTDLLNFDAIRAFLDSTHEKYYELLGDRFGTTVPAIFTDDVTIKWDLYGAKRNALPWTEAMKESFASVAGYDLTERLADLFYDTATSARTRYDYFRTVNHLFDKSFIGQMSRWCREHGIALTGHCMGNNGYFSDVMNMYYLEQIPAVDSLGKVRGILHVARRARSVAEQFDKPDVICEAFAGTGQEISFDYQKRATDYLTLSGVSLLTPHVSLYSLRGGRKKDHPPTFSYHQPWWKENKPLAKYQQRIADIASHGKQAADLLLIDPIESYALHSSPAAPSGEHGKISRVFDSLMDTLYRDHVEFAYGSEHLMAEHAHVEGGKLILGTAPYSTVVLPYMCTIRRTTLELLRQLIQQGGRVIVTGKLPLLCEGERCDCIAEYLQGAEMSAPYCFEKCIDSLSLHITDASGKEASEIISYHRRGDGLDYILCLNRSETSEQTVSMPLPHSTKPYIKDLWANTTLPCQVQITGGIAHAVFTVPANGTLVLQLKKASSTVKAYTPHTPKLLDSKVISAPYTLSLKSQNALVLDKFAAAYDEGNFAAPNHCIRIKYDRGMSLKAVFSSHNWNGKGGKLHMECPERWSLWLNGKELDTASARRTMDISIGAISIDGYVAEGENTVVMKARDIPAAELLSPDMRITAALPGNAIEPIYITGDFAVNTDDRIHFEIDGSGPPHITGGELTADGMPFYCGDAVVSTSVKLRPAEGESCSLRLCDLSAAFAKVRVNGVNCGSIAFPPFSCDISKAVRSGNNKIELELIGTARNMFGPHHGQFKEFASFVSPGSFAEIDTDMYNCVPFGIKNMVIETKK